MWVLFVFLKGVLGQNQRVEQEGLILRKSRTRAKNMLCGLETGGIGIRYRRHFLTRKMSPEVRQSFR